MKIPVAMDFVDIRTHLPQCSCYAVKAAKTAAFRNLIPVIHGLQRLAVEQHIYHRFIHPWAIAVELQDFALL